jgi:hypothetical protein
MMGDLLGSLIWEAKSGQYCVIGGGSLQMVSRCQPKTVPFMLKTDIGKLEYKIICIPYN